MAGLDKTHEEIPDVGAADCPVVKTVLAMEDGGLEESLGQARLAFGQDVGQVLPGVLVAGENQANGMLDPLADDARGEDLAADIAAQPFQFVAAR